MKSRSVFVVAFLWWLVAAGVVGALFPFVILGTDQILSTGASDNIDPELWRAVVAGAAAGVTYGVVAAVANAGLSVLLPKRSQTLGPLTQLIAGLWVIAVVWWLLEFSNETLERAATAIVLASVAWIISPAVYRRYRSMLTHGAGRRDISEPPVFRPTHMLTSTADSDDVQMFVRNSLRTFGSGNALFTVEAGGAGGNNPATQVYVDAGGTGHALNLDVKKWEQALADGAADLPGFVVTDDRTLAIAPAGLSAVGVISEGISLVQRVSGTSTVRLQFEGFGH